ncbi:MAG TPA: response regulator transcription factor [Thermoanaerobaculia bacterium]|nr:response regulator transcription factor [Thermoanaerobaculia bacterium]
MARLLSCSVRTTTATQQPSNPATLQPPNATAHETCKRRSMVPRAKVLIVEDDSDVRRLYAIGLNQHGFEVKLAANGAEAVERIHAEKPDVVLLDWLMPLMDGGEVLGKLGENGNSSVQVIVISGQPAPEELDPRIRSWLVKPVTIEQLVAGVAALLGD